MGRIMRRIEAGQGTRADVDTLLELGRNMIGTTICVLSDSAAAPVISSINKFGREYDALLRHDEPALAPI
jgi:NADH-quinone oxidoreductase subunit F